MKVLGVIPARKKSSRFPDKPLADIHGLPMIIHVAQKVEEALGKEAVLIATDDEGIRTTVTSYGYNVMMTSENCLTGTDRLSEVSSKTDADIYLNIQGDEPMIDPEDILSVLKIKNQFPKYVVNAMCDLKPSEDPHSLNIPKLVVNNKNELIYMSRMAIPGTKNGAEVSYKKQVCIYAFNQKELELFSSTKKKTVNESYEDIEILRFIDLGYPVKMVEVSESSVAVDTPEDLEIVRQLIKKNN